MTVESDIEVARDAAIRSFIAIELEDATRRAIAAAIRELRNGPGGDHIRWVRPETLHVTLRFLGDIDPARVPALTAALRAEAAGVSPFALTLGELGAFPSLRRPQVLFFRAGPQQPLAVLASAVERAVVQAGFAAETRPFRPHLTLGRARRGKHVPVTAPVTPPGDSRVVDEIVLFHSQLALSGTDTATGTGATHTPLDRIALGRPLHP
jgi:2'-5' RNA ligase